MMKNSIKMKILSFILVFALITGAISCGWIGTETGTAYAYTSQIGSVRSSSVNVRSGPGTNYSRVGQLSVGSQVIVMDEVAGSDGQTWCKISYENDTKTGYMAKTYISMASSFTGLSDAEFEQMLTNQNFPESYKPGLRALHQEYPNWTFKAIHTGLEWDTVLSEESEIGRNLVDKSVKSSWKSVADGAYDWDNNYWPGFDGSSWQAASKEIIAYYMDPRNFLDSTYVFQFLDQKYLPSVQTAAGVEQMVKGTFMASSYTGALGNGTAAAQSASSAPSSTGSSVIVSDSHVQLIGPGQSAPATAKTQSTSTVSPGSSSSNVQGPGSGAAGPGTVVGAGGATYVDIIMKAAEESGVNPYVLTAMIIQEQGTKGNSQLISGTYSAYPGIYNYYNTEAYASGNMTATDRGLWWASQSGSYDRPWTSRQAAIIGGAKFYGEGYVNKKQNTFYLKKFNVVNSSNRYKHQYMANIRAAALEGANLSKAYSSEVKTAAHDFEIPIYLNMPASNNMPTGDGNPNNKLSSLYVNGFALTPSFNKDVTSYDLIVDPSVVTVNVVATSIASTTTITGTGAFNLQTGVNQIDVTATAQNGTPRTYSIHIVRQSGAQTGGASNDMPAGGPGATAGPGISNVTPATQTTPAKTNAGVSSGTNVVLIGPGGQ